MSIVLLIAFFVGVVTAIIIRAGDKVSDTVGALFLIAYLGAIVWMFAFLPLSEVGHTAYAWIIGFVVVGIYQLGKHLHHRPSKRTSSIVYHR